LIDFIDLLLWSRNRRSIHDFGRFISTQSRMSERHGHDRNEIGQQSKFGSQVPARRTPGAKRPIRLHRIKVRYPNMGADAGDEERAQPEGAPPQA
jgi:hypothetical protein